MEIDIRKRFEELEAAAAPLLEFLSKHYNMCTYAVVSNGRVEILTRQMGMPLRPNTEL